VPYAREIWKFESIGELSENLNNVRPWWYYAPNLFLVSLPWTAVWVFGIVVAFYRRSFLPVAWFFLVVLFFSFVNLKKNAYLLPVMPAQTLTVAHGLAVLMAVVRRRGAPSPAAFLLAAQSLVAIGFGIVTAALVSTKVPMPVWFVGGMAPMLAGWQSLLDLRNRRPREWLTLVACAYVLAISLFFNGYLTTSENFRRSPRPAAHFIAALLEGDRDATVVPAKLPVEATVYLPLDLRYNPAARRILYLLDDKSPAGTKAFDARLPGVEIVQIRQLSIPRASEGYRWKLFVLTVSGKTIARG
jgi:4-amino-4-deoxy-L-arabinose transferase-like glycosyltransferase